MMRKLVVRFFMLLFLLGMSVNAAWAGGSFDVSELPKDMIDTLMTPSYCARLTGHASSTGGGKVYVNAPQAGKNVSADPRETEYVEGTSNVAVSGMGMSMAGMTKIGINAWAKADPGYWFAGFSYSNMGTDLGTTTNEDMPGLYANTYDIGSLKGETIDYVIYGTFEPIRIAGYEITGDATTASDGEGNMTCDLAVIFTPSGAAIDIDASDFITPVVSGAGWSLTNWDYNTSNAGKVTANVRFTTTSTDVAEYAGTLKLETQAIPAISMNVPLNVRTAASSNIQAIRYNKNKVKQGEGSLAEMIAAAEPTDVIKLNKDYEGQVVATKSFTLDLNGHNIEYHYNTMRAGEFDEAAIAQAALLVNAGATVTIAYSPYGGEIIAGPWNDAADVFGKLILNGGTLSGFFGVGSVGVVEQNGATINGSQYSSCAIASMGKATITDGKMNAMVGSKGNGSELIINGGIIDNTVIESPMSGTPGVGVQIGGGTCQIKKGTITGRTYGVQNTEDGGDITIEKLAVIKGGDAYYALDCYIGTTTVNCGKFEDPAKLWDPSSVEERMGDGRAVFGSCYFQTNNQGENAYWGQHVWRNTSGAEFREGYEFFVGSAESAKAAGVSVCHIGGTSYSSLEDAIDYANNTSENVVIIMDNDYTLPAGYYTLPRNATLLIPMSNEQGAEYQYVNLEFSRDTPTAFRKLVFADGVNLDVFGTIEVSGSQYSGDDDHTGSTTGNYGLLQMNKGSRITLQNGSVFRAWGYVTGDIEHKNAQHNVPMGEIDARRGATVYELFQMGDWGNTIVNGLGLVSNDSRFPITQYYIQNIEAPVKYHPGAHLIAATTVSASGGGMSLTMCANEIKIIGVSIQDVAMFLMDAQDDQENTWVRKWYDASKDQQVYEVNSGAHIGNLVINLASSPLFKGLENVMAGMEDQMFKFIGETAQGMGAHFDQDLIMNSGQYVLPITSNFKLHLLTGSLDFTQSTALIPGSELEIDKEARVFVTDQRNPDVIEGSLYIYDWQDWTNAAAAGSPAKKIAYTPVFDDGVNNGAVPDVVRDVSSCETLGSAKVNVHGTFDTNQGYVFTSEHGGNIFSTVEDAGTFMFTAAAKADGYYEDIKITSQLNLSSGIVGDSVRFYPAYLRNSIGTYVHTAGTAANQSYCYIDFNGVGQWKSLTQEDCFVKDENDIYYIKPQEYVALTSNEEDSITHTYSDAAGKGRLFILLDDAVNICQWWEVEAKDNYFHCIHPENDTYYEWDNVNSQWKEKKFTITWKDWDGSTITTYSVPYGTQAEWLSSNPTREKNLDYTYDFTGWSPALGKVTSDVTYTATYEEKQIKYTVVFVQDGGVEIERHLLARNEMPVCENLPTRTGYILEWSPALAAVTGNQTYTATWLPEPPTKYEIKFMDYDGETELKKDSVEVGTVPTPPANPAGKLATVEYTYAFDHWSPALEEVSATSAKVYTAVYREEAKTYTINFYNEDDEILKTENLAWGATPTPPAVSKTETGYTFTYVWKNTADATKSIESVKGAADYKPVFTRTANKYTVTLQCNVDGACTFTGAGIYDYNTSVTPTATIKDPTAYEFVEESWKEETTHSFGERQVTGDITLSVMVKAKNVVLDDLKLSIDGAKTVSSATNYEDVVITSDGLANSSQIINANNITLYGNADFVLKQTIKAGYWYSFAVPWRVDATSGVYLGSSSTPAVLGKDFEIIYYDGSIRAAQGPVDACWVYMKNLSTKKVLEPGRAYMIFIKHGSQSQIVFRKKVQESLLTTSTTVELYNTFLGDIHANWNAIANPALYHAYLYAGSGAKGFFYKSEDDQFDWYNLDETKLVVGEPVYIQAPTTGTIVANSSSYAAAPRRAKAEQATSFDVQITAAGTTKRADHISVQIDENKEEDKYVIGKDLTKFGVSAKLAQMWINRYDVKLCFNTIVPEGDNTSFPMSIYAPKAGEYTIAIEKENATDDYTLYLTYNGEAIWNLSDGAYTANLNKGTDANYGLRISVRKAPEVATGMDEAVVDAQGDIRKVLINNQVLIIRGEKVYSIDGQLVK